MNIVSQLAAPSKNRPNREEWFALRVIYIPLLFESMIHPRDREFELQKSIMWDHLPPERPMTLKMPGCWRILRRHGAGAKGRLLPNFKDSGNRKRGYRAWVRRILGDEYVSILTGWLREGPGLVMKFKAEFDAFEEKNAKRRLKKQRRTGRPPGRPRGKNQRKEKEYEPSS